jgi:hypothetical protein
VAEAVMQASKVPLILRRTQKLIARKGRPARSALAESKSSTGEGT